MLRIDVFTAVTVGRIVDAIPQRSRNAAARFVYYLRSDGDSVAVIWNNREMLNTHYERGNIIIVDGIKSSRRALLALCSGPVLPVIIRQIRVDQLEGFAAPVMALRPLPSA